MALVYPLLRAFFLFLNILDTFKTLKLPPPSARSGGQPSTRAMSQRKRNMKGCMTVWLIWCCLSLYERTLDGIVGMFIPFYSEVKSLVLLFFILTRARGAEPIFLHVLRPLIKPHVRTLDALLDIGSSLGDFVSLVLKIPQEFIMAQYRHWTTPPANDPLKEDSDLPSGSSSGDEHTPNTGPRVRSGTSQIPVSRVSGNSADRAQRAAIRSAFVVKPASRTPDSASMKTNTTRRPARNPQQAVPPPTHEIWHPPPSSYDSEDTSPSGLPTPPSERSLAPNPADDWRQYEPFPSAYPPTPLPSTSTLPASVPVVSLLHDIPETEESRQWRQYEPFPSAYPATPLHTAVKLPTVSVSLLPSGGHIVSGIPEEEEEPSISVENSVDFSKPDDQHFRGSLRSPRELPNPGSDGDLSDEQDETHGVQMQSSSTDEMNVDSEDEEEEDDFDVTLRTPPPPTSTHVYKSRATSSVASASTESIATRLSTTDNGSELRTRTNSQTSTLSLSSDESVIGRKRPLPKSLGREYIGNRIRRVETSSAGDTLKARSKQTLRPVLARTGTITVRSMRRQTSEDAFTSTADEEAESDVSDGESAGVETKRRRIGGSASEYTTRRVIAKPRGYLEPKVPRMASGSHTTEARRPPIPETWVKKLQTDNPTVRVAAGKTAPSSRKTSVPSVGRTLRSLDKK